jgi:hypothetical protein
VLVRCVSGATLCSSWYAFASEGENRLGGERRQVQGQVAHSRRGEEPKIGKLSDKGGREGSAFAHGGDDGDCSVGKAGGGESDG